MDAVGTVRSVLLLGGTSEIGLAVVRALSLSDDAVVVLAGRDSDALSAAGEALPFATKTIAYDALDTSGHDEVVAEAVRLVGDLDLVVQAAGVLGDQAVSEANTSAAVQVMQATFVGSASVLLAAARQLRVQGHGTIVVLSSVAGLRARKANFVYGASKAGLDAFAIGLGDSLAGSGVRVIVVRPGFVRTRMTEGMAPAPMSTTAEAVAADIVAAVRGRDEVVYSPKGLRPLFWVLRVLPRVIFRKLPG